MAVMASPRTRRVAQIAKPLLAFVLFVLTGEVGLRLMFPGGGRYTPGAPGGRNFEHLTVHDQQRGRLSYGEKRPGVPRIMIVGDSVTWGWGVRRWEDLWPEQLALRFEAAGRPHDLAVFAQAGRNIDAHVEYFRQWAEDIRPDVFIYQWYVNDLELKGERPSGVRWWHRLPWHGRMRASYLYDFLDNRLNMLLPPPDRTYVEYLLADFGPASAGWTEFERQFHELATRVSAYAPIRLLVLYPMVPFAGEYPLKAINDRMRRLAGAKTVSILPMSWIRHAGVVLPRPDAPAANVVRLPAGAAPRAVITRDGYFARDALEVVVRFASASAPAGTEVATLDALDEESGTVLASASIVSRQADSALQDARVLLDLPDGVDHHVRLAVGPASANEIDLASLDLVVDHGFEVLDLTDTLNTFDTHVSMFDAHPNARAHQMIAEEVFARVTEMEARGADPDTASTHRR
jgi:lysophospholipase L1-like esterase